MLQIILLGIGFLILIIQQYIQPISSEGQFLLFLVGIILLGIPHGAADLLVAMQNTKNENQNENQVKKFSKINFSVNYIARLVLFGIVIWIFPLFGNLLFIIFAAYHFGETDLLMFKKDNILGNLLVFSYGMLIMSVILLCHVEEATPVFHLLSPDTLKNQQIIGWLTKYRYLVLSFTVIIFLINAFFYFLVHKSDRNDQKNFFLRLALILLIVNQIPMTLGFTFYFVMWHSVLSLQNIINYLRKDNIFSISLIIKQISIYSFIAMLGIAVFGLSAFIFIHHNALITNAVMMYVFMGLAVLTAPHMQIMHDMYKNMKKYAK